jgi:hypothetical protein
MKKYVTDMNNDLSLQSLDSFPCRFFLVGKVEVTPDVRKLLTDDEIIGALKRHTQCDFGEVSWQHYNGNLQLIAESRGIITSVYRCSAGKQFRITTHLDDFDPRTRIFTV